MPYFEKNFLLAMTVLDYLAKLKSGLGLAFDTHFLHDFSIEKFLFNSLSMDKVSMSHLSFWRYQTKCVIKFFFRHISSFLLIVQFFFWLLLSLLWPLPPVFINFQGMMKYTIFSVGKWVLLFYAIFFCQFNIFL